MKKWDFILLIVLVILITLTYCSANGPSNSDRNENNQNKSGTRVDNARGNHRGRDSDSDSDSHSHSDNEKCPRFGSDSDSDSDSHSDNDNDNERGGGDDDEKERKNRLSFIQWANQNNKTYSSDEFKCRYKNFKNSIKFIDKFNKKNKNSTMILGLTQFSDLTHDEFKNIYLSKFNTSQIINTYPPKNTTTPIPTGKPNSKPDDTLLEGASRSLRAPESIDWRTWSMVSKVKNQGGCGSCYAFAAVASLETMYFRKYNSMLDFSEQNLVDCTSRYGNGGCGGGWMHNCYQYIIDNNGINQQHNYPYVGRYEQCKYNSGDAQGRLSSFVRIAAGDEKALTEAVATLGSVAIAYDAGTPEFRFYQSGIYQSPTCSYSSPTHAVTIVGYGSENGRPYWILKNSWGDYWGEKGYFRMTRGYNMCGVANWASYPVVR